MSLRDTILAYDDIVREPVTVPEWGGMVIEMRTPTVSERGILISQFMKGDEVDYEAMYPALVVNTAYDPTTGEKIFTADDIEPLKKKSSAAMERLGNVATRLSGMENAAKRMAEGKDDSTPTLNSGTPSGSQSDSTAQSEN